MKNPRNAREWQEAVDLAEAFLMLDDCRMYGLLQGGPAVDRQRCIDILDKGRRRGFVPHRDPVEVLAPLTTSAAGGHTDGGE